MSRELIMQLASTVILTGFYVMFMTAIWGIGK